MISETRTRGVGSGSDGGSDEFIELFNATGSPITLDSSWTIAGRSSTGSSFTTRWTGTGKTVPAWGHYLMGGSAYTQTAVDDSESGITDAGAIQLLHAGVVVDALCYVYGTVTLDSSYGCPGTPVVNPHNNGTSTDVDSSLERLPGGAAGNCTDTGNNAADFAQQTPATPQNTASPPTP